MDISDNDFKVNLRNLQKSIAVIPPLMHNWQHICSVTYDMIFQKESLLTPLLLMALPQRAHTLAMPNHISAQTEGSVNVFILVLNYTISCTVLVLVLKLGVGNTVYLEFVLVLVMVMGINSDHTEKDFPQQMCNIVTPTPHGRRVLTLLG